MGVRGKGDRLVELGSTGCEADSEGIGGRKGCQIKTRGLSECANSKRGERYKGKRS